MRFFLSGGATWPMTLTQVQRQYNMFDTDAVNHFGGSGGSRCRGGPMCPPWLTQTIWGGHKGPPLHFDGALTLNTVFNQCLTKETNIPRRKAVKIWKYFCYVRRRQSVPRGEGCRVLVHRSGWYPAASAVGIVRAA